MATRQRSRASRGAALPPVAEVGAGSIPEALPDVILLGDRVPVPLPDREARIATAAYHRAERRGFAPGYELDDWLAAEREVDAADGAEGAESLTDTLIRDLSESTH